ncbi:MAG: magnesium transporter CorA family protein [Alphaproteobacteria bacterium]|nr:magnesium transporter CorA family protein [Alphaproteobacteria bacterium]
MIKLFCTNNDHDICEVAKISENTWIKLSAPTKEEIQIIANELNLEIDDINAAIDPEEKTRIEIRDDYVLIIADIPVKRFYHNKEHYKTIPLGIILTQNNIVTVCSEDTEILTEFHNNNIRGFSTKKRIKFVYQIMLNTSILYQQALISIEKRRMAFEERIENITDDFELIGLHGLESALVYIINSLRGNISVLNRISHSNRFQQYPEDKELLYDAMMESQQAIEMAQIYREIIDGTRELVSAIINSRLNNVMKQLTSITVLLSIPMVISGMYGMNVDSEWMPFAHTVHGFGLIGIITIIICIILMVILKRKKML